MLYCLNNLIIQNEQQTGFLINGKDYFCIVWGQQILLKKY